MGNKKGKTVMITHLNDSIPRKGLFPQMCSSFKAFYSLRVILYRLSFNKGESSLKIVFQVVFYQRFSSNYSHIPLQDVLH